MKYWHFMRITLLAATCSGVFLTFGKVFLAPSTANSAVPVPVLPTSVPLQDWQFEQSNQLPLVQPTEMVVGQRYQYQREQLSLTVEMRYLAGGDTDIRNLNLKFNQVAVPPISPKTLKYREGVGFYAVFTLENKVYLSACINPQGGSTVTQPQFTKNRYIYDLKLSRVLPVLLGQQTLQDNRCLWTNLSIPLSSVPESKVQQAIETAWLLLYQWWQPRFPNS